MTWVYRSLCGRFEVGYFAPMENNRGACVMYEWWCQSRFDHEDAARAEVNYLNGGSRPV